MPPLTPEEIEVARGADAVVVNCVTGHDLTLRSLQRLSGMGAPVHLDFHSRALSIDTCGRRHHRRPPDWHKWLQCAELLQCNRSEAVLLSGAGNNTEICPDSLIKQLLEAYDDIATGGVEGTRRLRWIYVTLGVGGVLIASTSLANGGGVCRLRVPVVPNGDPTDAGDVYGAVLQMARMLGFSVRDAAMNAAQAPAASCCLAGAEQLDQLASTIESMRLPRFERPGASASIGSTNELAS